MPKDSQPDNKKARMEKCNGQTPITQENMNKNPNAKRKSIAHNDVQTEAIAAERNQFAMAFVMIFGIPVRTNLDMKKMVILDMMKLVSQNYITGQEKIGKHKMENQR